MATYTVPTTGVYENSRTGGRFRHVAGAVIDLALAVDLGMPGAALPADAAPFSDAQVEYIADQVDAAEPASSAAARTATADGTGTGLIADGTDVVTVTSANANHIVTLPTPTPGTRVEWYVGANGFELRTNDPATVGINSGTGANAESAIPANTYGIARCATATNWVCHEIAADGVLSTVEVAAP